MTYRQITPQEAHSRLAELHAVDVRSEHEFRGPLGRVSGSTLIPLPELDARMSEIPAGRPLLLVCRSGSRSGKACEKLNELGVGPAVNLAGGMIAWNRAQLPTEFVDPASLEGLLELIVVWVAQVGPLTPDGASQVLRERLGRSGASFDAPTHAAIHELLDFVEESLTQTGSPPDLDLTLMSFRRSLAVL